MRFRSFSEAIDHTYATMLNKGIKIHRDKWQGFDVSKRPEAATYELHHYTMQVPMVINDLTLFRNEIKPNLPWADDHFAERIGGHPLNPGVEWANWPWGQSADKSRIDSASVGDPTPERIFDHTYAQRYWPKWAGRFAHGIIPDALVQATMPSIKGIYFRYGDLGDVIEELKHDPTTRQAILPVFFPEDTGYRPGRRKPCSLFYHFMLVNDRLDISYQLRSCDITHHFRDDIYLTVRLLLWVLDQLRRRDGRWLSIGPGDFIMQIANLHCFINDYNRLARDNATKSVPA
jgi:hypothetical protein